MAIPVHFFGEYPSALTLAPATLVTRRSVVSLAASGLAEFDVAREKAIGAGGRCYIHSRRSQVRSQRSVSSEEAQSQCWIAGPECRVYELKLDRAVGLLTVREAP